MTVKGQQISLPEQDYCILLDLIHRFNKSQNRQELQSSFETNLLPLLGCHSAYYAWVDPELSNCQLIDCLGFSKSEFELIQDYIVFDPVVRQLIEENRSVMAIDIDVDRTTAINKIDEFFKGRENHSRSQHPVFDRIRTGMYAFGNPGMSILMALQRHTENPMTERDVRLFELLSPHVFQSIRNVMLNEKLGKYRSFAEALSDSPTALALVGMDLRILFCNKTFSDLFGYMSGQPLPHELGKVFSFEKSPMAGPMNGDNIETEVPFFTLPQGVFRLTYSLLSNQVQDAEKCWYLRLKPATDPYNKMNQLIEKAGLTWREMEICCLIHDGLGKYEISARLCISPHTVRTHLKKVHKKLGVSTRTQLVAFLNQIATDQPEQHI